MVWLRAKDGPKRVLARFKNKEKRGEMRKPESKVKLSRKCTVYLGVYRALWPGRSPDVAACFGVSN